MLAQDLTLPCGVVVKNRLCKSAMTEGLADVRGAPTKTLEALYTHWADKGTGLLITGNVMVDRRYLERIGNVVIESERDLPALSAWAAKATAGNQQCWVQISHPGRQCTRLVNTKPIAPSSSQLHLLGFFAKARAMDEADIEDVIERYVRCAHICQQAGFTGVQIHAAHGYLVSQFLSPLINRRHDKWGGSLGNRARLLLRIIEGCRSRLGKTFPIAVKLNSKDFQQGGFEFEECLQVAAMLSDAGVDLLEISGGSYASMAFFDGSGMQSRASSTQSREAYFLRYAEAIAKSIGIPLMITGGFRELGTMQRALQEGLLHMIGIARPYCVMPDLGRRILHEQLTELPSCEQRLSLGRGLFSRNSSNSTLRALNHQAEVAWFYQQLIYLANNRPLNLDLSVRQALLQHLSRDIWRNIQRKFVA